MPVYTDQTGRTVSLTANPKRIISLVPSQTEWLHALGLDKEVVGITKFCVHPTEWFRNKQRVGGTKALDIAKIRALQPDLVIAGKEENVKEQVELLGPVWTSDVGNISQAFEMMRSLAEITGREAQASAFLTKLENEYRAFRFQGRLVRTAYLIWQDPYMAAGGDTFISDMLRHTGFENVFAGSRRYPEVSISLLKELGTELVLLSSEPFPFGEKHLAGLSEQLPGIRAALADGEMFSWYGSRMQYALPYISGLRNSLFPFRAQ